MGTTSPKAVIMDETAVNRAMTRIAHEILERNEGCEDLALVGIVTRGDLLAKKLVEEIKEIEGVDVPLGSLDISFYRDDYATNFAPAIHATNIPFSVNGKRVVLVDDSIVRGTTSRRIVTMLKEAGATEVHVRIASPPMTDPCFYGVDTSTREELISARKNTAGVCEEIGADSLVFLSPESLLKAGSRKELCMACFTGQYPTALYQSPEEANKDVKC